MNKMQKELYQRVMQTCKREGIPVFLGKQPTAGQLRRQWIDFYEHLEPSNHVPCISCYKKELEALERDRQYNLRAYRQMTDKEVLMSEQREQELRHQEIWEFINDIRKFIEESRKVRIWVGAQRSVA